MNPWLKVRSLLKKTVHCNRTFLVRVYCSNTVNPAATTNAVGKKIEDFFFDQKVQSILKRITGLDYEKIFKPAKREIVRSPKYEFVTDKMLKELQDKAHLKAIDKLQMPPILDIREPCEEILCKNPEIQGYTKSKVVFTDISAEVSCRDRIITVREPDGTLRTANWEERFRLNQIFFPIPGRSTTVPKLFESPYFEKLLDEESYLFILDLACVQFEPDDPYYHKVINETFEHISKRNKFHELRSTRHFGPMAFYLAWKNNIDSLIIDMIQRQMISDASSTVKLLHILHSELETSLNFETASDMEIVQEYIKKYSTTQKDRLELVFDSYAELQDKLNKEEPAPVESASHSV